MWECMAVPQPPMSQRTSRWKTASHSRNIRFPNVTSDTQYRNRNTQYSTRAGGIGCPQCNTTIHNTEYNKLVKKCVNTQKGVSIHRQIIGVETVCYTSPASLSVARNSNASLLHASTTRAVEAWNQSSGALPATNRDPEPD